MRKSESKHLDILIEEGKIERISTRQMLNTAECQNCNWNLIGSSDDSERIVQKSEQHNMQAQHKIHVQAMQCYDIKFNDVVALHEYEKYNSKHNRQVIGETQDQLGKSQSFYLNSDVKKGKMTMICNNGNTQGHKVIDVDGNFDSITESIREWTDHCGLTSDHDDTYIILNIIVIAILNRIDVTIHVPGGSINFQIIRGG